MSAGATNMVVEFENSAGVGDPTDGKFDGPVDFSNPQWPPEKPAYRFSEGLVRENVPAKLRELPQWVCWRYGLKGDKDGQLYWAKVPVRPFEGLPVSVTDPSKWVTFDEAIDGANFGADGIGFVFAKGDGLAGLDFDDCIDPASHVLKAWGRELLDYVPTYAEESPSATGIKAFGYAAAAGSRKKTGYQDGAVEIYTEARFFTVTGMVRECPGVLGDVSDGLQRLYLKVFGEESNAPSGASAPDGETPAGTADERAAGAQVEPEGAGLTDDDCKIIETAKRAVNGHKVEGLLLGQFKPLGYASHSEADMALIGCLAFYTQDPEQLARIFRSSGLYRPKWDEKHGDLTYGQLTMKKVLEARACQEWPEPTPLAPSSPPPFPAGVLQGPFGLIADDASRHCETPPELARMTTLAMVSTAVRGRYRIETAGGHSEVVTIFGAVAMKSGHRKSTVLGLLEKPLIDWEQAQASGMEVKIRENKLKRKLETARLEKLVKEYSRAEGQKLAKLASDIDTLEKSMPEIPIPPRLIVEDVTPEKLGELLQQQGRPLTLVSDESGILDTFAGRYDQGTNLDLVLKAYSGEPARVDRVSRESVVLNNPLLTIFFTPQVEPLLALVRNRAFRDRGLLARFDFVEAPSTLGHRTLEPYAIPTDHYASYCQAVNALLSQSVGPAGNNTVTLKMDPDALARYQDFARSVEKEMLPGQALSDLTDYGGKLPGRLARYAALLHLMDHGVQAGDMLIGEQTMLRAINLLGFLKAHYVRLFQVGGGPLSVALRLWEVIRQLRQDVVTARDVHQAVRGTYKTMAEVEPGLKLLVDYGYLRRAKPTQAATPGRPSVAYDVNPTVMVGC